MNRRNASSGNPGGTFQRKIFQVFADGALRAVPEAMRWTPLSIPLAMGLSADRDVEYVSEGTTAQRLDVYRPLDGRPPYPVLMYIHGGALRFLSKSHYWNIGGAFGRKGFLTYNIDYRLPPEHPFPSAIEDVCAAYEHVVQDAEKRGGDLDRFVIAGDSCGAALAAALMVALCYRRPEPWAESAFRVGVLPKVVWLASGAYQLSDPYRFSGQTTSSRLAAEYFSLMTEAYLGDRYAQPTEETLMADPLLILESGTVPVRPLPAVYSICGSRDPIIEDTRRLETALDAIGAQHDVRYYRGGTHVFHLAMWSSRAR